MEDRFGHRISYLRVSVTDRCNERCAYCMPQELQEWLPRAEILSYEETLRLTRIAAGLGVTKVRITGGEPLTRRGIVDFIREVPKISGVRDVGVSTMERCWRGKLHPIERSRPLYALRASTRLTSRSIHWIEACTPRSLGAIFFLWCYKESTAPWRRGSIK